MPNSRQCHIVSAFLEKENASGDGAYDLFDLVGTPEEIGKAIADSIKAADLFSGRCPSAIDAGHDLFLTVKIKFCKPEATQEKEETTQSSR